MSLSRQSTALVVTTKRQSNITKTRDVISVSNVSERRFWRLGLGWILNFKKNWRSRSRLGHASSTLCLVSVWDFDVYREHPWQKRNIAKTKTQKETKPKPTGMGSPVTARMSVHYNWAWYTMQHRTVLIIIPLGWSYRQSHSSDDTVYWRWGVIAVLRWVGTTHGSDHIIRKKIGGSDAIGSWRH